jgi:cellulose synthase/poly-beta-1,6-N-acetylglucosamine synthase-like glycosyltransferase
MEISVLVPSYGRPQSLQTCLLALAAQSRAPDEVVVVTRAEDAETRALVARARADGGLPLREAVADLPGQIRALATAVDAASGDVVAITDDDAAPRPDWVRRLERWFGDGSVAGVGGRDVIAGAGPATSAEQVGRVRWFGKIVGNHHLGVGAAQDVDVLKGANMAFRRELVLRHGFDERLRGKGAQVHNDLKLSLSLRRAGGRLVYDPALMVDHMPAPRPAGDDRLNAGSQQQVDAVHNETLALLEFLPAGRRAVFAVWALAVGRRQAPGLALTLWTGVREPGAGSWPRLRATFRGRREAWRTFRRRRASTP